MCSSTWTARWSTRWQACCDACPRRWCSITWRTRRCPPASSIPRTKIVRELIDKGKTWVKLSGAYSNSKIGPPAYPEATKIAQAFVKAAPERLVWGSDWPHPGLPNNNKPDDALLFDLMTEWAPDEATRNRILVQNPETLYGFGKS